MELTSFLKKRKTPITKLLPHGAIKFLAKKHNLVPDTVSNMLRGKRDGYNSETVLAVLESALEMISKDISKKTKEVATIKEKLDLAV